jgi:hypothetical protein
LARDLAGDQRGAASPSTTRAAEDLPPAAYREQNCPDTVSETTRRGSTSNPGGFDLLDLVLRGLAGWWKPDAGEAAGHWRDSVRNQCPLMARRPQSNKLYFEHICDDCPQSFVFGQVSATSRAQLGATLDNVNNTQYRRYEARWHRCTNTGLPRTSWSVHGCDSSTIFQPSVLVLA